MEVTTPTEFLHYRQEQHKLAVLRLVKYVESGLAKSQQVFHLPSDMLPVLRDVAAYFEAVGWYSYLEDYPLFHGKPYTEMAFGVSKEDLEKMHRNKRFREWLVLTKDGDKAYRSCKLLSVQAREKLLLREFDRLCQ